MNLRLPRRYLQLRALQIPFEIWVPVVYALISSLWIYFSDAVVTWLARTPEQMRLLSTYKGWGFVASTATLLYIVLRRIFARIRTLNESLEQRVKDRTALAEQRADQLRALALQLTQAEQRERRRVAHILHEHFQQTARGRQVPRRSTAELSQGPRGRTPADSRRPRRGPSERPAR